LVYEINPGKLKFFGFDCQWDWLWGGLGDNSPDLTGTGLVLTTRHERRRQIRRKSFARIGSRHARGLLFQVWLLFYKAGPKSFRQANWFLKIPWMLSWLMASISQDLGPASVRPESARLV
jgi:hypothetical protein